MPAAFGNDLPGGNDLGRNAQYGSLLRSSYLILDAETGLLPQALMSEPTGAAASWL